MAVIVAPKASAARPTAHSQDSSAPVKARAEAVVAAGAAAVIGDVGGGDVAGVDVIGVIGVVGVLSATAAPVTGAAVTGLATVLVGQVVTVGAVTTAGAGAPQLGPLHDAVLVMVPVRSVGLAVTA
jgi:hypothetical protein